MTNRPGPVRDGAGHGPGPARGSRLLVVGIIGLAGIVLLGLMAVPFHDRRRRLFRGERGLLGQQTGTAGSQPPARRPGRSAANYLHWYQKVGQQYAVPWTILAGIGTVESDNGQTTLPGVDSGSNAFGAAGPMQIGIGGAAGNVWGGQPVTRPARWSTASPPNEDGGPDASVYDPADAIAGAAKYLLAAGVATNPSAASSPTTTCSRTWKACCTTRAPTRAATSSVVFRETCRRASTVAGCATTAGSVSAVAAPNEAVATAISYAEDQIGKPYLFGGTGPDAFDCSGLVMTAYRAPASTSHGPRSSSW